MYFPIGWPKVLNVFNPNNCSIRQLVCNRDKILFSVLTDDTLLIYYCKPCLLIVLHQRPKDSLEDIGMNELVEWRPDSSSLVVVTSCGYLLLYKVTYDPDHKGLYEQIDPPQMSLRRDSAELFIKEIIPPLHLSLEKEVPVGGVLTSIGCIRDELMVATTRGQILRYRWDMTLNRDYCVDLRRVPFCLDQHVSKAIPISEENAYIIEIDYSPLIGGFAVVFNDGRAAFLTAYSLKFDPNQMQGIWAPNIDDATCASVNHKFRLITFGRKNSQCVVYSVDETTGGLIVSHHLIIPGQVFPGNIGPVHCMRWSPDACALAVAWSSGGISLWSTFGSLLMCTLSWDYGLNFDLSLQNPLKIHAMEWSAEGYQLWMAKKTSVADNEFEDSVIQLNFVKSALTVNPCMSHQNHLYLQGEDRLYVNLGVGLSQVYNILNKTVPSGRDSPLPFTSALVDSKQWIVVQIPSAYSSINWPIRYTAINASGDKLVVAGKAGLAHYSLSNQKWKLFGNETQEKDMIVTGGLLWWKEYVVAGCYNIPEQKDELRLYPSCARLSNIHMTCHTLQGQVLLLDSLEDSVLVFCADGRITIYNLIEDRKVENGSNITLRKVQTIDLSALCVHPACFVSLTLTSLRIEPTRSNPAKKNNFAINVSGRLLMVYQQDEDNSQVLQAPTVLASCVENVWSPRKFCKGKPHLTEALWLFCGAHGMRVWLPLFPRHGDNAHTFMSKRIMLPFQLKIYPLAILFEDAIILGAENDTILYTSDANSPFSLPFCVLERTSQVYLHHILRQLIRRNLGFHAWEIARCCTSLPYFPHSLELLLHEVLEEEATSKEPIPDAQLPSVVEFIQEFPVYLDTVVRCARKTEIALWPYLFSVAGKPTQLFQQCLSKNLLETAASYLIILQNLESSAISRQYATMLLDSTLSNCKWELSKELVRFLKAIDPNDVECVRSPPLMVASNCRIPQTPPVNGNEEDLSLVLGTTQVSRGRSFSTSTNPKIVNVEKPTGPQSRSSVTESSAMKRKKSVPTPKVETRDNSKSAEEFFMDVMIERHARRLLSNHRLNDLGSMAANLDFPLVRWLARERHRAAVVDSCTRALKDLHADFVWPYPTLCSGSGQFYTDKDRASISDITEHSSQVGDSGYTSYQGLRLSSDQHQFHQQIDERSMVSEPDSWFYSEESECANGFPWSDIPSPQLLDHLSRQVTTKGSPKADIQLRYLLQLLTDAGCLQWALLVSILLRDAMAVYRLVNSARSPDQNYEAVNKLREDIITLSHWANTECLGYKPFMTAIQGQANILTKVLSTKQKNSTTYAEPLRNTPTMVAPPQEQISCTGHLPNNSDDSFQKIRNDESPTPSINVQLKEKSSCVIS
ncbi:guanine nucleotide exchange factor subunit Rich [Cimex lectularius]|uniref:Protein RIC1 homolog n=1 Tax=Cimex lectularius TaxID=79782 RepID=A0A8I6RE77_CIMLE|nr:guanine nucleotide exchange factor subunit Rich [Cimex lectularius]